MIDELKLHQFAGGNVCALPPLFDASGDYIFLSSGNVINVYSTSSGERVCQLMGASGTIISIELELLHDDVLVACTKDLVVYHWKWKTGVLLKSQPLNLPSGQIISFNHLNMYKNTDSALAFVTVRCQGSPVKWFVMDPQSGRNVPVIANFHLTYKTPIVDVDTVNFKNLVIAQESYLFFVNYESWTWCRLKNAHDVPVTVVKFHPKEEVVATGDKMGKIFLWRNFMSNKTVITSLYHWHHTPVTGISFSASGSSFYSSGMEAVLVAWNVEHREIRKFLPRLNSIITHIAVNKFNTQIAVTTADNSVHIIGSDFKIMNSLQELTYIVNDKTSQNQFPVGLRMSPINNLLVLNGRMGHLQFISPYTRKLFYNMDIVLQNKLSFESDKILYDTCVEKVAFNIQWMATGEVFNDGQHLPELRLKFWQYDETIQSYKLNTNVELPHEGGFKAIEFSHVNCNDKLLCATVGHDNEIKIWALENSDNIYKQGTKVWACIAQTRYKKMNLESISFSQDGSLLAAGYGNTLCLYKSSTLKLRAALSASPYIDAQKCQIIVPEGHPKAKSSLKKRSMQEHRAAIDMFNAILEDSSTDKVSKQFREILQSCTLKDFNELQEDQKELLKDKICNIPNLTFSQKLIIYQRLGINMEVQAGAVESVRKFVSKTMQPTNKVRTTKHNQRMRLINFDERFKAKYRLEQHQNFMKLYKRAYSLNPKSPAMLFNMKMTSKEVNRTTMKTKASNKKKTLNSKNEDEEISHSLEAGSQITRVQFATNENAHLVIACTENRVFVWNLLNLRIKSIIKLSVRRLAFNSETNVIAVITTNDELFVYHANGNQNIYHHANMPKIHDMLWIPGRDSDKAKSKYHLDSLSTLFFLTESQEIMHLKSVSNKGVAENLATPALSFSSTNSSLGTLRYSTFGKYIANKFTKNQNDNKRISFGHMKFGIKSKETTQMFMDMTTHTMPPLYVICYDFVKALIRPKLKSPGIGSKINSTNGLGTDIASDETKVNINGSMDNDTSRNAVLNKNLLETKNKLNSIKADAAAHSSKLLTWKEENLKLVSIQPLVVEFE